MQEKQEKKNRPWGFGCEGSMKENWNTNREKQLKVKKNPRAVSLDFHSSLSTSHSGWEGGPHLKRRP